MPQTILTQEQIDSPLYQEFLKACKTIQRLVGILRRPDGSLQTPCVKCGEDCLERRDVLRRDGVKSTLICKKCYDGLPRCKSCGQVNYDSNLQAMYEELEVRSEGEPRKPASSEMCVACSKGRAKQCDACQHFFISPLKKSKQGRMTCPTCQEHDDARFMRAPRRHGGWEAGASVCSVESDLLGSRRRFGIELEVNDCIDYDTIKGLTVFGAKDDGTQGVMKEFVSPILGGNAGYLEVEKFCREANSRKWGVTSQCGYHLHIDLSSTSEAKCRAVAMGYLSTYDLWGRMVHNRRRANHFCKGSEGVNLDEVKALDFRDLVRKISGGDRYYWANWQAYYSHNTLEIRLHSGTLSFPKIINWVSMHLRFTDWCANQSASDVSKFFGKNTSGPVALNKLVENGVFTAELEAYARKRAVKFKSPFDKADTKMKVEEEVESSVE